MKPPKVKTIKARNFNRLYRLISMMFGRYELIDIDAFENKAIMKQLK